MERKPTLVVALGGNALPEQCFSRSLLGPFLTGYVIRLADFVKQASREKNTGMDLLKIVYTGLLRQTRYSLRVIETELANQLIRFSQFNHLREG